MKNKDFIYKFCLGHFDDENTYRCGNLTARDGRLFSYNTCIAEFEYSISLYINMTKYSRTTSRHQNLMMEFFDKYRSDFCWEIHTDVPINTKNLSRFVYDKQKRKSEPS